MHLISTIDICVGPKGIDKDKINGPFLVSIYSLPDVFPKPYFVINPIRLQNTGYR